MGERNNYVQVACYLSRKQKKNLDSIQERVREICWIHIPMTELIRDSVSHFLDEIDDGNIDEYIKQKGIIKRF